MALNLNLTDVFDLSVISLLNDVTVAFADKLCEDNNKEVFAVEPKLNAGPVPSNVSLIVITTLDTVSHFSNASVKSISEFVTVSFTVIVTSALSGICNLYPDPPSVINALLIVPPDCSSVATATPVFPEK